MVARMRVSRNLRKGKNDNLFRKEKTVFNSNGNNISNNKQHKLPNVSTIQNKTNTKTRAAFHLKRQFELN